MLTEVLWPTAFIPFNDSIWCPSYRHDDPIMRKLALKICQR